MFLQNVGYRWNSLGKVDAGAIFRASAVTSAMALRRQQVKLDGPKLLDPQLYFLDMGIGPAKYKELLATLATYPWFGMTTPEHDSEEMGVVEWAREILENIEEHWKDRVDPYADWPQTVTSCVQFQVAFAVDAVLLPARLITDAEALDDYIGEVDEAIDAASSLTDLPLYASVVIDEAVLRLAGPAKSAFIEAVVDAISARREQLHGAYLAVAMAPPIHDRFTHPRTVGAILRLCKLFAKAEVPVTVNYAESLGLACLAFGAEAYGTGYATKERRLAVGDHVKRGGGFALPKFYSKNLILDLRPEDDLERFQKGELALINSDKTPTSEPLLNALQAGTKSGAVVPWRQTKNNVTAAELHYLQLHRREGTRAATVAAGAKWLASAQQGWDLLVKKYNESLTCDGSHVPIWRAAFDSIAK